MWHAHVVADRTSLGTRAEWVDVRFRALDPPRSCVYHKVDRSLRLRNREVAARRPVKLRHLRFLRVQEGRNAPRSADDARPERHKALLRLDRDEAAVLERHWRKIAELRANPAGSGQVVYVLFAPASCPETFAATRYCASFGTIATPGPAATMRPGRSSCRWRPLLPVPT